MPDIEIQIMMWIIGKAQILQLRILFNIKEWYMQSKTHLMVNSCILLQAGIGMENSLIYSVS